MYYSVLFKSFHFTQLPYVLKELLFLGTGIGSVLGIGCYASLGVGISIRMEKMALTTSRIRAILILEGL